MGFLVLAWKAEIVIVGCIGSSMLWGEQGIVRDVAFLANQAKPEWNQFLANQVESAENQSMVTTTGPSRDRCEVKGPPRTE